MILYLSGAISSDPDYKDKFDAAESYLSTWKGHVVLNPAVIPFGLRRYDDYMNIGYEMLRASEGIVMLRGWKDSPGAKAELKAAIEHGLKVFYGIEVVPFIQNQ